MKLGIISFSKLLTVFIRENMTKGLNSEIGDVKITYGKLWGSVVCLLEPDSKLGLADQRLGQLLKEYKIGQAISLDVGRVTVPVFEDGDIVVSSTASLWREDSEGFPVYVNSIEADPKLLDGVLNALERYGTEEAAAKAVVGSVQTFKGDFSKVQKVRVPSDSINCWDNNGYFLASHCQDSNIPWALVRLTLNEQTELDRVSPSIKWDMAKKCFWIVKGILDSSKRSNVSKRAR